MPELPEVETICRGLRARAIGRRIVEVKVLEPRLRTRVGADFAAELAARVITGVDRRAKYIVISLDNDAVWVTHLGMSGKLIWVEASRAREKHDHIIVRLEGGYELRYHDPRRFGLSLVTTRSDLESLPQMKALGPEPLMDGFNADYLYGATRGSRRRIRDLLIDQTTVAGLGNIYANEILFHAGVRPTARAWKLSRAQIERIAALTPKILTQAIRWCGTSFSDYRDVDDRSGEFQRHLRVYDRDRERCRACAAVIKRVALGNRSAFYCPQCQK
jgi:formamidopyrimidine-DNA glycosylase